jgi:hypothetical protein
MLLCFPTRYPVHSSMSKLTVILSAELVSYKQFHPCICLDTDKVLHADKVVCHYVSQVHFHIRDCHTHNDVQTTDIFSTHGKLLYVTGRKFYILAVTLLPTPWLERCCPQIHQLLKLRGVV